MRSLLLDILAFSISEFPQRLYFIPPEGLRSFPSPTTSRSRVLRRRASHRPVLPKVSRAASYYAKRYLAPMFSHLICHYPYFVYIALSPAVRLLKTQQYLNAAIAKDMARRSWDVTPNKDMSEFLGWVLSSLRIRGQRVRFWRTEGWTELAMLLVWINTYHAFDIW